jgi:hypothetical protein
MATKALIHNGCTTGVEAYVMGVPAISYRETVNSYYDYGFYRLPNLLSHQCFEFDELRITLEKIIAGELGAADGEERKELADHYLAAQDGQLACERIINVLEEIVENRSELPKPSLLQRFGGWCTANGRHLKKRAKAYVPGTHAPPEFHRHRYPGVSLEELSTRIRRFQQLLNDERELSLEELFPHIFRIST